MTVKEKQAPTERYAAPALDKGLDILELLAVTPEPLTQIEIARGLGRAPNEIYRMLSVLLKRRFVVATPDGDRYRLSLKLLALANAYPPMQRMREISEPIMRRVSWATKQSCHLAIWDDGNVVVVAPIATPGLWRWSLRAGSHIGLYNSGSGQALAAFQNPQQREFMIESHRPVDGEPVEERAVFLAKLDRIQAQGYLREPSTTLEGVINIAFPILDMNGEAMCTLTCPYIRRIDSSNPPGVEEVFAAYRAAAEEIGEQLRG
ncbi:MAG: IclR family transcriptional regulator [Pikeienuella sp.]